MELYSETCIHSLQYTLTHLFILFFAIIPSGGFTYCTGLPSCARAKLLRTIKSVTISKENNQQFFSWHGRHMMFETNKAFTSNSSQLFISACKLQVKGPHLYYDTFFTKPILQPPTHWQRHTSLWFGMAALTENKVKLQPTPFSYWFTAKAACIFYSLYGDVIQIYITFITDRLWCYGNWCSYIYMASTDMDVVGKMRFIHFRSMDIKWLRQCQHFMFSRLNQCSQT